MKKLLILLPLTLFAVAGCGPGDEGKASAEDKAALQRLSKEGLVPPGAPKTPATGAPAAGGEKGTPVNAPVDGA